MPYSNMLELTGLPTLESRRSLLKLCLNFKIVHGLVYFPDNLYTVSTTRSCSRLSHSLSLCPYSNSSSQFHYSYIPHSISLWNSLPIDPSNYNFVDFKSVLSNYLINYSCSILHCSVFCTVCISVTLGCTYTSLGYLYILPMAELSS